MVRETQQNKSKHNTIKQMMKQLNTRRQSTFEKNKRNIAKRNEKHHIMTNMKKHKKQYTMSQPNRQCNTVKHIHM